MDPESQRAWAETVGEDYFTGNYHFAPGGTRYLVYTAVSSGNVNRGVEELYNLKQSLIMAGHEIEYFHASEDKQLVRNGLFSIIRQLPLRVDSIVIEKAKAAPRIQPIEHLYPRMFEILFTLPVGQPFAPPYSRPCFLRYS